MAERSSSGVRAGLRLALAGGGTGGHLVPGLRLAEHLRERGELEDLLWFQTGRAVEERVMEGLERRLDPVPLLRVALPLEPPGGGAPSLARLARRTLPAARTARRVLARSRSRVLLGLGGFTSLPAALAARTLNVPVALLEINAAWGKATRVLSPLARRVLHAWPQTLREGSSRHVWTGPPLPPELVAPPGGEREARAARSALGLEADRPLLLVLGGSQGAGSINSFLREASPRFLEAGMQVLHQTGPGRQDEGAPGATGYRAVEYLDDVPGALRAATLVLCRGGASTLAEVAAAGRPVWVVPYPHHGDRHQERNALALGEGARVVVDANLGPDLVGELIGAAAADGEARREAMARGLVDAVRRDGLERMVAELRVLARAGS